MYFSSRVQAGRMLSAKLADKYRYENCAIIAIDDGGVIVGSQIAMTLHCVMTFINSASIHLPLEPEAVAGITNDGVLAYNPVYSQGELDEILSENRSFIEQEKLRYMHELNQMTGQGGTIDKRLLKGQNIIVVSEGLKSSFQVELVYEFLKPVQVQRLIFAVPLASVAAVDRMHILGDEIHCLDVLDDYRDNNHYYDKNDIPSHEKIVKIIENVIVNWQ
jgi:putative phosphoribosyl transferase